MRYDTHIYIYIYIYTYVIRRLKVNHRDSLYSDTDLTDCFNISVLCARLPSIAFNCTHSSSGEVRNEWRYASVPPQYLHGVERENFNFTFCSKNVI